VEPNALLLIECRLGRVAGAT